MSKIYYLIIVFLIYLNFKLFSQTNILSQSDLNYIQNASSQSYKSRPGGLFLLIPPDSRSAGMGNSGIATSPDVTSIYYNNAKLPFANEKSSINVSYTPWFVSSGAEGMFIMSGGGYYKYKNMAFSSSVKFFKYGNVNEVTYSASTNLYNLTANNPYELSVDLGYSMKITKGLSLGIIGKFTNSNIQSLSAINYKSAKVLMGDLSLFYEKNINYTSYSKLYKEKNYYDFGYSKLFFGLVLSNIGNKFSYNDTSAYKELPPTKISLGIGYSKIIDELNKVLFTVEATKLLTPAAIDSASLQLIYNNSIFNNWLKSFDPNSLAPSTNINAGIEYWYNNLIAMRAGYTIKTTSIPLMGITFGLSLRYKLCSFDLAYFNPLNQATNVFHPLSNTIRFGLTFYFN